MTDQTPRPDPVTEAGRALLDHEMGDRDVPGNDLYLSADEVRAAIIAIEQEAAALARAEAGVSAAVEALADVRARRSTFATAEAFDSAMLEAAGNILAARSAAALARAEAGVSLEEMGKAWAAVEAALPEHRYFKVEHDSDDDPSWYLAVWRSDGIFPDPIRWAQADTLLDGLTRLALELRTPR